MPPSLQLQLDRDFVGWLAQQQLSLVFTTYQSNWLGLLGINAAEQITAIQRQFPRAMGVCATSERFYLGTRYQIWQFDNVLHPGQNYQDCDRLYIPRRSYTTGDLDSHDLAIDSQQRLIFVATRLNSLATLSEQHSCQPLWQPPFISKLINEDRCHLNGLAMLDDQPRYVTVCSRSDVIDGWRDRRVDGGCVLEVPSGEVVVAGLSMPHSPRVYRDRLWVLNSGTGEFGYVDCVAGRFEPIAFCPGYSRGLAFWGNYAIVSLSQPREATFAGLPLETHLNSKDTEARCGFLVIDLSSGSSIHWARFTESITELYDVAVLPGVKYPMALGLQTDEIAQILTLDRPGQLLPAPSK